MTAISTNLADMSEKFQKTVERFTVEEVVAPTKMAKRMNDRKGTRAGAKV